MNEWRNIHREGNGKGALQKHEASAGCANSSVRMGVGTVRTERWAQCGHGCITKSPVLKARSLSLFCEWFRAYQKSFKPKSGKISCISTSMSWQKYEEQIGGGVTGGRRKRLSRSLAKQDEGSESFEKITRQNWRPSGWRGSVRGWSGCFEMERQDGERLLTVTGDAAGRMGGEEWS